MGVIAMMADFLMTDIMMGDGEANAKNPKKRNGFGNISQFPH